MTSVAAGAEHALAVSAGGELFTWGHGANGRLGHAQGSGRPWFWNKDEALPRRVNHLAGETIRSVAAGHMHSGQRGGQHPAMCCTSLSSLCAAPGRRCKAPRGALGFRHMRACRSGCCMRTTAGQCSGPGPQQSKPCPGNAFGANAAAPSWLLCTTVSLRSTGLTIYLSAAMLAACPGRQLLPLHASALAG